MSSWRLSPACDCFDQYCADDRQAGLEMRIPCAVRNARYISAIIVGHNDRRSKHARRVTDQLRAFIAAVDERSFSAASQKLLSRPVVSETANNL
jgi:hypothetical protein